MTNGYLHRSGVQITQDEKNWVEILPLQEGRILELDETEYQILEKPLPQWDEEEKLRHVVLLSGELVLFPAADMAYQKGHTIRLTRTEFNIITYLMTHYCYMCSRNTLIQVTEKLYKRAIVDNTLSKYISRLRHKLGEYENESYVQTRHCFGYKWNIPVFQRYIQVREKQDLLPDNLMDSKELTNNWANKFTDHLSV